MRDAPPLARPLTPCPSCPTPAGRAWLFMGAGEVQRGGQAARRKAQDRQCLQPTRAASCMGAPTFPTPPSPPLPHLFFSCAANSDGQLYDDELQQVLAAHPDQFRLNYALSREQKVRGPGPGSRALEPAILPASALRMLPAGPSPACRIPCNACRTRRAASCTSKTRLGGWGGVAHTGVGGEAGTGSPSCNSGTLQVKPSPSSPAPPQVEEHAGEVFELLRGGAHIYFCGELRNVCSCVVRLGMAAARQCAFPSTVLLLLHAPPQGSRA